MKDVRKEVESLLAAPSYGAAVATLLDCMLQDQDTAVDRLSTMTPEEFAQTAEAAEMLSELVKRVAFWRVNKSILKPGEADVKL